MNSNFIVLLNFYVEKVFSKWTIFFGFVLPGGEFANSYLNVLWYVVDNSMIEKINVIKVVINRLWPRLPK